ncbi:MAG: cysteine--tRNA ligase [Bdellovibrionales bacterium]|nr:cysteine--tRNA ligase [Bdellovibrionales bacterium]
MAIRFYNSLSRTVEEFVPLKEGEVTLYSCGPTVYNFAHIGNLRAFLFSDLLKRYLRYRGYRVDHVMNITDVDDKTIRDSKAAGQSLGEFTDYYLAEFIKDLDTLSVDKAERMPRATEEIPGMLEMISQLIESGHAYQVENGDVYFKVSSFPSYGELVQLDASTLKANAGGRLNAADEYDKENAQDFALWKAYSKDDGNVCWDAPFGKGRPGWHLECSVMSTKYLGQPFDIHTGGVDLKFPHHTNEIAQSECCGPKPFVRYWLHNEHLMVNGKKMSKSEGNFYTLRDLLQKGYDPRPIRLELLKTHYRQQLDFREDNLEVNAKTISRLDECSRLLRGESSSDVDKAGWDDKLQKFIHDFEVAMDEDLNISEGLAVVLGFVKEVNKAAPELSAAQKTSALLVLEGFDSVFGLLREEEDVLLDEEIQELIERRARARKERDFALADKIRDDLLDQGIELKDTPEGVKFRRF